MKIYKSGKDNILHHQPLASQKALQDGSHNQFKKSMRNQVYIKAQGNQIKRSEVFSQQNADEFKRIMMNIKIKMMRDLFIRKLRRNQIFKQIKMEKRKNNQPYCKLKGIQFSQFAQHIIIATNIISIVIMLFLSGISATLVQFSQNVSTTTLVIAIKCVCVVALTLHFLIKSMGYTYRDGQYLQYVSDIFISYLRYYGTYIDIATIVLFILFIVFPTSQILSAIIFAILVILYMRAASQLINLQAAYIHTRKIKLLWQLTKILIFNFILAHIVGVILLGISHFDEQNSWLVKYGIDGRPWYVLYVSAYYWGAIIITTIGFGDISAGNWREAIVVAVMAMFACVILGFNISQFTSIFGMYRESAHQLDRKKVTFKQIIIRDQNNNAAIDPFLKKQIYRYIDYGSFGQGNLQYSQRNTFISQLPDYLKQPYLKAANKRIFNSVQFINQLKHQTLAQLTQSFSNRYVNVDEQIFQLSDNIYILEEGNIGLSYNRKGSTVNGIIFDSLIVRKKQNLLLLNSDFLSIFRQSKFGLVAKQYAIVWNINIEAFQNLLKLDSMDFQYYCHTLHRHSLDEDEWETIACPRCSTLMHNIRHSAYNCPQISYIPSRHMIIYRYLWNSNQQLQPRLQFKRKDEPQFRISVLKYYKNYFEAWVRQNAKAQSQKFYIAKFFKYKKTGNPVHYFLNQQFGNQNQNIYYEDKTNTLKIDIPENFQYYFPRNNSSNLIMQPLNKKQRKNYQKQQIINKFHHSQIF